MINFIKHKNIFLVFTVAVVIGCLGLLAVYGLKPSIEFTGGSITEIEYNDARPSSEAIMEKIGGLGINGISIYSVEDKGVSIRTEAIDDAAHTRLLEALNGTGGYTEKSFDMIGPVIGRELTSKTTLLVVVSLLAMLIYIAIAFRNVPGPVSPWIYGAASFLILAHDVLVPLAVFSFLGKNYGMQITIPIITALLTVVGYAINNVIVVYDRIRENLVRDRKSSFEEIADKAINQTLTRQINTSVATLIPVFAIYFYGGLSLKYFALALILGIVTGTYSSVFLASQVLVLWLNLKKKGVKKA
jgi:preprotein translocase subunit SecF